MEDLNEEFDRLWDETEGHPRQDCQCPLCIRFREIDAMPPVPWTKEQRLIAEFKCDSRLEDL